MLNDRMRRYAEARFRGLNQLESARSAGYKGSDNALKVHAARLRNHPEVVAEIERLRTKHAAGAAGSSPVGAPSTPAPVALAPRHAEFVTEFMRCGVAADAARAVGLSPKSAHRIMARPDVRAAIDHARDRRDAAAVADRLELERFWTAIMRGRDPRAALASGGVPEEPPARPTLDQSMRAAAELGKIIGATTPPAPPTVAVATTGNVQIVVVDNGRAMPPPPEDRP